MRVANTRDELFVKVMVEVFPHVKPWCASRAPSALSLLGPSTAFRTMYIRVRLSRPWCPGPGAC
eukprot:scaffold17276_cov36-Tisochrysis_lutea.AAC.2